ncbi:hypothetical protein AB0L75_27875 [Streptomyces sp. NPDC052101]|uniref:hypothetical protein n=1 Tax=Streptomyces sp. NPDC052101 TaxID=3155763 RepID=UPI00342D8D5E
MSDGLGTAPGVGTVRVLSLDHIISETMRACGVTPGRKSDVQANLTAAIDAVAADPSLGVCLTWLQERLGVPDRHAFARELLRIYRRYDDCVAGNLTCRVSDRVLSALLQQEDWREYVVYNLCGLALYERLPVEFHSQDTLDAFEGAKRWYEVPTRLRKEERYHARHATGQLGDHGLGRGWAWSNIVYGGTPVATLLWPAGGDDLAEIEDDIGFYYEVGLHVLTPLGVDEAYLARVFDRIMAAGRRRSIPALLSLDYAARHLGQEKQYARTADGRLRVARFCPEYAILWELAENNLLHYHYDTRHRDGIDATDGYLVTDFNHRIEDVGAEMATGELLNTTASMVVEAFGICGNIVTACSMVWREIASWYRHELLTRRATRTTGAAVASQMWAFTAYRHPCEEWAAVAWRAARDEILECGKLFVSDESCRVGLANLFDKPYTLPPDDVVREVECECGECAEIQRTAHRITRIADGDDWQQQCDEIREWIADCVLHLTLCQRSSADVKREIEIRLSWEFFSSPKCLATMVGSILCGDPTAGVASDRPANTVVLPL